MMNIKIVFEADSIPRLREQMLLFLGAPQGATLPFVPDPEDKSPDEEVYSAQDEPEREVRAPKDPKEKRADTKELNKMKEDTLNRLKDLFVAGKGKMVRELLVKYGHGAKVFPEVEAKYFPAIKEAIDKELGA